MSKCAVGIAIMCDKCSEQVNFKFYQLKLGLD